MVVPTRGRADALARCLRALAAQTVGDGVEVVVVDDGAPASEEVAAAAARVGARLVRTGGRGAAAARNAGVEVARAPVVCLTDDDCVPERDWVERLVAGLGDGVDVVAGDTVAVGGILVDAAELISHAPEASRTEGAFAPSNNLACRKETLRAVPFDPSYPGAAGEDRDWCARLGDAGYVLGRAPNARVAHAPHMTITGFARRQLRYGEGAYRFREGRGQVRLEPAGFYGDLLRRAYGHGLRVGLVVTFAQVVTALGFGLAALAARRGNA